MLTFNQLTDLIYAYKGHLIGPALAPNTRAYMVDAKTVAIRFHNTEILHVSSENHFTYQTGGWTTYTTKQRLNQFGPLQIYQQNHKWFYGQGMPFVEGMTVDVNGEEVV